MISPPKTSKTVVLAVLLAVLLAGLVPASAVAQDSPDDSTTDESTTNNTDSEDDEGDSDEDDNSVHVTAGNNNDGHDAENATVEDLWNLLQASENSERPTSQNLVTDLGPGLYVTDLEFDKQAETATITIVSRSPTGKDIAITDATAFDRSAKVSVAESREVSIPEDGTFTITVPATMAPDGNQGVTISPGDGKIYRLSNGVTDDSLFSGRPMWEWFGWFGAAVVVGAGFYVVKQIRDMDTGSVETADGTTLSDDVRIGLTPVETDEADGGDSGE